ISPTTVTGLPGSGFLSTPAAMVVSVHGSAGLLPMVAAGWSHVPLVTAISGCRILFCAYKANARRTAIDAAKILDFTNTLRSARVSHPPRPQGHGRVPGCTD